MKIVNHVIAGILAISAVATLAGCSVQTEQVAVKKQFGSDDAPYSGKRYYQHPSGAVVGVALSPDYYDVIEERLPEDGSIRAQAVETHMSVAHNSLVDMGFKEVSSSDYSSQIQKAPLNCWVLVDVDGALKAEYTASCGPVSITGDVFRVIHQLMELGFNTT